MARRMRRQEKSAPSSRLAGVGRGKALAVAGAFVVAAVAGALAVRKLAGPGDPVVDVEALERQEAIRTESIEKITRCEELIRNAKLNDASRLLQQVTEADPDFYLGHLMLGYAFMQLGKMNLAEQATRRAYELEPEEPTVSFQMGQIETALGNVGSAIDSLRRAIRLREQAEVPPAAEYHVTLADALAQDGQATEADQEMDRALAADRAMAMSAVGMAGPEAQVALGRALIRRNEVAEAARLFAQAASQQPDRADWQFLAARAYFVQAKFAQAASYIQQAVDLDPANPIYVNLKRQIDAKEFGTADEEQQDKDSTETDQEQMPSVPILLDQ